jgi:restriction system protein
MSGPYQFSDLGGSKRHTRQVKWTHPDIARTTFQQDLLYSFGAFITVCRIRRNDAERRVQAVLDGQPDPGAPADGTVEEETEEGGIPEGTSRPDLAQAASDEVTAFIRSQFQDHDMARLVEAVLQAEGFRTQRAGLGADGGADILAGRGALGLDPPYLCVQVKATQEPVDVKVFRELAGTMAAFKASQGLLVSWGGFRQTVLREARQETFKIRLWDQSDLVQAIYRTYDKLPPEVQAELPLKRVWMLVHEEPEGEK